MKKRLGWCFEAVDIELCRVTLLTEGFIGLLPLYRSLSRYEPITDACVVRNEERCGERSLQQSDDFFTPSGAGGEGFLL